MVILRQQKNFGPNVIYFVLGALLIVYLKGLRPTRRPKNTTKMKNAKMSKMYFGKNMSFWKVWLKTDSIAVFAAFFYIG